MNDAHQVVLNAFKRRSSLCIHVLGELTSIPRDVLLKITSELVREGHLIRLNEGIKGEYVFCPTSDEGETDETPRDENELPMLMGMSEKTVRDRVAMLNCMKSRLIRDWHPTLNKVIADYEKGLRIIESLRCVGFDDDDSHTRRFGRM